MKVNIFVLEDSLERVATFEVLLSKAFPSSEITFENEVEEAKKKLLSERFDLIFLDHDLGGKVFVDSSQPDTGYQIAKFISDNKIKCQQIIVHSMNPTGAQNMLSVLKPRYNAVLMPFPTLIQHLRKRIIR
jgi:CheY-like chemotaxis protein